MVHGLVVGVILKAFDEETITVRLCFRARSRLEEHRRV